MSQLVRCKACGYVMPEGKLKDKCPACGALRQVFEPYQDPVAENRRRVLDRHIHPIAVHFPTSFAVALLVLVMAPLVLSGTAEQWVICTARVLSVFLPLLVLAAFLAGVMDGRIRFRKIKSSRILKRKILFGLLFLLFAAALSLSIWLVGLDGPAAVLLSAAFALGGVAFAVVLGLLGMGITDSAFPGK